MHSRESLHPVKNISHLQKFDNDGKKVFSNVVALKEAEFDLETENVHHTSYIIPHTITYTHIHTHGELHPRLQSQRRSCMP